MSELLFHSFPYLIESINTTVYSISITHSFELILGCTILAFIAGFICPKMPGVLCPRCREKELYQWVVPGKHCPICNYPC